MRLQVSGLVFLCRVVNRTLIFFKNQKHGNFGFLNKRSIKSQFLGVLVSLWIHDCGIVRKCCKITFWLKEEYGEPYKGKQADITRRVPNKMVLRKSHRWANICVITETAVSELQMFYLNKGLKWILFVSIAMEGIKRVTTEKLTWRCQCSITVVLHTDVLVLWEMARHVSQLAKWCFHLAVVYWYVTTHLWKTLTE